MLPLDSLLMNKIFLLLETHSPKSANEVDHLFAEPDSINVYTSRIRNRNCCDADFYRELKIEKRLELLEDLVVDLLSVISRLAARPEGCKEESVQPDHLGMDEHTPDATTFMNNASPLPTRREKEVLCLLTQGYCAKEIAKRLFISETTVITHKRNLKEKFKAKNTVELISKTARLELTDS